MSQNPRKIPMKKLIFSKNEKIQLKISKKLGLQLYYKPTPLQVFFKDFYCKFQNTSLWLLLKNGRRTCKFVFYKNKHTYFSTDIYVHLKPWNWIPWNCDLRSWDSESWEQDPENWTYDLSQPAPQIELTLIVKQILIIKC